MVNPSNEVEYWKMLFHNEYEARQRTIEEMESRRIKELFEMAELMSDETNTALRDLMDSYLKRLDNLRREKEEVTNEEDKGAVEVLIRQCKKMTAELFQTMKRLNVLDEEEIEIGAIKKREYVIKKAEKYEKALTEIVSHSDKSYQGEIAKKALDNFTNSK